MRQISHCMLTISWCFAGANVEMASKLKYETMEEAAKFAEEALANIKQLVREHTDLVLLNLSL